MSRPLVAIEVYAATPGTGGLWRIDGREPENGSVVLSLFGPRDVVIEGLAEYVESLHGVASPPSLRWPWL